MNRATVTQTSISDSAEAGRSLGQQIATDLENQPPDALIVFASAQHDYQQLLEELDRACRPALIVGCSSAGEFTSERHGTGEVCALAIRAEAIKFSASIGEGLRSDRGDVAVKLVSSFQGMTSHKYPCRSSMVLTDALAGHADDLLDHVNRLTGGTYQFFGGGAGDDARFQRTHVFYGTKAYADAAVALEILSHEPLGIGTAHGWQPASSPMRVTESEGLRLISLNSIPVVEALQDHAERTGQRFDLDDPIPFFLHNIIGIETTDGFKLRVPLAIDDDGAVQCAADVPAGATVFFMNVGVSETIDAAASATRAALDQVSPGRPSTVIFFDCVATRLRMGEEFGFELDAVADLLHGAKFLGCNTYGQIARAQGQLSGFHNCTAVACAIPV